MNTVLRNSIDQLKREPKLLFLMDSIGALLTSFLLFVVLRNFHEYVGMSKAILSYLSLIALIYSIYSAACFLLLKQRFKLFLIGIGIANLLYCTLTIGLLINYRPFLTTLGVSYFLVEMTIICLLAYLELKVAALTLKQKNQGNR